MALAKLKADATQARLAGLELPQEAGEPLLFDAVARIKIVFVDGVFDPDASDDLAGEGVEIARLGDVAAADVHWAKEFYGTLEARGQTPVPRPLATLNTAFATDGVVIRATAKVAKPVSLIYLHKDQVQFCARGRCGPRRRVPPCARAGPRP
mgnify:CR=1 FL=1